MPTPVFAMNWRFNSALVAVETLVFIFPVTAILLWGVLFFPGLLLASNFVPWSEWLLELGLMACVLPVIGIWNLSIRYLRAGRPGLAAASRKVWVFAGVGIPASAALFATKIFAGTSGFSLWLTGAVLTIPYLHLLALRVFGTRAPVTASNGSSVSA